MNVRLDGNESDTFSTTNDFRKIGIVKDPLEYSTSSRATNSVYRQTFRYELSSLTGSEFFSDQVVSFGANTASVVEYVPADGEILPIYIQRCLHQNYLKLGIRSHLQQQVRLLQR